jgi:hypothetical protein
MPADRLQLDAETILQAIPDEARHEHARGVLDGLVEELQEHEAREPIASLLVSTIRTLERVEVRLADAPSDGWIGRITDTVPIRVLVSLLVALVAAIGALLGLDVSTLDPVGIADQIPDPEGDDDGRPAP